VYKYLRSVVRMPRKFDVVDTGHIRVVEMSFYCKSCLVN